jgi:hypothetical protein
MKVTNRTSFTVRAFAYSKKYGNGGDVNIAPGETKVLDGPRIGEMGGGACRLVVPGDVTCQELPDDDNGFQLLPNEPLVLEIDGKGVNITAV